MSWTQAICADCWNERNPESHTSPSFAGGLEETCCYCGNATQSGIYVRVDPSTVAHPSAD